MAVPHPRPIIGGGGIGDEFPTLESAAELLSTLKVLDVKRIDTAALYLLTNIGASETYLGELGAADQGFTLNTKPLALGLEANGTLSPEAIEKSLATSYERLKLKGHKVDVYTLHVPNYTTPLKD
ncbi:hypothetical protein NPX13_g7598 [Xylaria arbuscula]|uniref:NADP-dependent oxidoreductase domain-containing protein n=1 Tax=Xylaria arbuscula TaxID=114810 RepID=A0A9W8NA76_9PEZI|nr:hypothetical protein NPX13_g7598 [Xylaria arbuscula]